MDLSRIAQDLQIRKVQVEAVVQLLDEGNTIPFITRYRKERTGGLDEETLRIIQERIGQLRQLAERKQTILRSIEGQGKLTEDLRAAILAADNPKRLEDLYLPYKPKKRSLAQAAREKGLDKLALAIWEADPVVANLDEVLPTLINPEQQLNSSEDILQGVQHILAEMIAENADIRAAVRGVMWDTGKLNTTKSEKLAEGQGLEYKDYFQFSESIRQIPPHRVMAINRGEKDNALIVKLEWDEAAGRRVTIERLPLPLPCSTPTAESATSENTEATTPPTPPSRGSRGGPAFINRTEDLAKHPHREFLERCIDDGLSRLLVPSLEREIRREMTQRAENHAVTVFARNLRSKLLAAPLRGKRVLAIDPAFRTGCKLAALDETGNLLGDGIIFPHPPQKKEEEALARLEEMVRRYQIHVIAIGNGTACRETEELVSKLLARLEQRRLNPQADDSRQQAATTPQVEQLVETTPEPSAAPRVEPPVETTPAPSSIVAETTAPSTETPVESPAPQPEASSPSAPATEPVPEATTETPSAESTAPPPTAEPSAPPPPPEPLPEALPDLAYVIVNEAGASVYSASTVGREEFPNFDATLRGTISIGRRLQDPLSELVKIDPQHVGVGLYQHDVNPKHLRESLESVIESCVNTVGVDLNTASVPLLRHVSGMNVLTATNIVEYRKSNGNFRNRQQLLQVEGIGEQRFIQAAGFLKISDGEEPLDSTWIHPESYPVARQLLAELGYEPTVLLDRERLAELQQKLKELPVEETASRLQVGVPTLRDILDALARPGRDPREDLPPPVFKKGILKLEDLQPGMELKGTVLNVVDFGAFIDIGLKDSGLVHISQMANRYVKSPYDVVSVGDVVSVWVLSVDEQRHRVSLTMIQPGTERRPPERPRGARGGSREGQEAGPPRGERRPPRPSREREAQPANAEHGRSGDHGHAEQAHRGQGPGGGHGQGREAGGRPPREGGRGGRDRGPGGPPQSRRSTLPPRGTTRLGSGGGRPGGPQPAGRRPQEQPVPPAVEVQSVSTEEQTTTPPQPTTKAKPKLQTPLPRLSEAARSGKVPLSSFSELAALMQARDKSLEPTPEPPSSGEEQSLPASE